MVDPEAKLLYDYDHLLSRLYSRLPTRTGKASRFELPRLQVERIGSKTIIRNFKQLADVMRREPRILMRYLLKELGASGNYDEENGMLVINVKVSITTLNNLMQRFVKTYVICPTCGAPDTRLERRGKAWVLICEACGAEQPVPPL
ncbi:translation initiation factor IF-2 subunit beta [Hyperthermus butylicus]|uniref:Translation initiation factor 2 subunit beta n=1 Tax=Hyperthermus butylicus (strain DSM 5456 / JCM 9403 / PLM1-5) TaxID=415426 RepID=A2BLR8_HYPBU|nr:translation initiation factor IF-2 subunit beta [Hyperthermus butylicus]ABM80929.1 translation initiation factor 2, beta subunit [Hyperthermus butylicus DSM 5456]